jgi:hypothetical protein
MLLPAELVERLMAAMHELRLCGQDASTDAAASAMPLLACQQHSSFVPAHALDADLAAIVLLPD